MKVYDFLKLKITDALRLMELGERLDYPIDRAYALRAAKRLVCFAEPEKDFWIRSDKENGIVSVIRAS